MLVKSRVAWAGKPRNTILDVDPNDPDVQALLASGRLVRVNDPGAARQFTPEPDAIVGTPDGVPAVMGTSAPDPDDEE